MGNLSPMTPVDLAAWKAHMGLTYETAAASLGVSRPTVARWLSGQTEIPLSVGLACSAIDAGLVPWGLRSEVQDSPVRRHTDRRSKINPSSCDSDRAPSDEQESASDSEKRL